MRSDEYSDNITRRDNLKNLSESEIPVNFPHPICPINLYFEGDEDKCDVSKCDYDIETRCCTERCKINVKELQKEIDKVKPIDLGTKKVKGEIMKNKPKTKLVGKEHSPLIIRRYSLPILTFVALITDDNLDDLDDIVDSFFNETDLPNTIQGMRNVAGQLSEVLVKRYQKTEGVAVIIQADKMTISSLGGDFMNATPCRIELYSLLNFATQV